MLVTDIFRLATRMFRTNRSRTLLTILGISVGIGAILFLVSLGYGLQKLILERITTSDALLSLDVSTGDLETLILNEDAINETAKIAGVERVSPLITTQALITIDDVSSELTVNFADQEYLRLDGAVAKTGTFYTDAEQDHNKIIFSSSGLKLFNLDEKNALGKKVRFVFYNTEGTDDKGLSVRKNIPVEEEFTIAAIIEDEASNFVYMPRAIGTGLGYGRYSKLKVKVDKEEVLGAVRDQVIERGYVVSALSDVIEQANQVFGIIQIVLASFGIVALIVSAIGMFNTMTIALLERTQEIGVMKALGATSIDIWNMFLAESVIIGFFGGLGGILMGVAGGQVFNYAVNILAGALGGEKISLFYTPWWFVITIITFSTFVGFITGFYPARRAANINPLVALRYK